MKRDGTQFYTKGGKLIDISSWDKSNDINELKILLATSKPS